VKIKKQADETFDEGIIYKKEAEFERAKANYEDLFRHVTDETILGKIRFRMEDQSARCYPPGADRC